MLAKRASEKLCVSVDAFVNVFQPRIDSTVVVAQRKLKYANNRNPDAT